MLTRKKRRILFIILTVAFFVFGGALLAYSQGFRFQWQTFAIEKVGAIYVHSYPADASIRLNGKPVRNESGILRNGTLINNLFPREYEVVLSREGYKDWRETAHVTPSLVYDLKYAVLIPTTFHETVRNGTSTADAFWILDGELLQHHSSTFTFRSESIRASQFLGATHDGRRFLATSRESGAVVADLDRNRILPLKPLFDRVRHQPSRTESLLLDPHNGDFVFATDRNKLLLFDLQNSASWVLERTSATSGLVILPAIASSRFFVAWPVFNPASSTTAIRLWDKLVRSRQDGIVLPGKTVQIEWTGGGELAILQDDGKLYLGKPGGEFAIIGRDARAFLFNGDGTMVVIRKPDALEIFSLQEKEDYWRFRLPDFERISSLAWYRDSRHLFVEYPDAVKLLSFTDLSLQNFQTVAATSYSQYDVSANRIYMMINDEVRYLEFPRS